jgi:hypothetical protein
MDLKLGFQLDDAGGDFDQAQPQSGRAKSNVWA